MTFESRGTPEFWRLYAAAPEEVRKLARKNYALWSENPFHPSLHFKKVGKKTWSVRVGDDFRATGHFAGNVFTWEWIGSHADYDKRL